MVGLAQSRGFGSIPRRQVRGGVKPGMSNSVAGELYAQAMEKTRISSRGRIPAVRPSSFPMCSIRTWEKLVAGASLGAFFEEESASGGYFTKVGTIAHENIQYWIGMTGKMYGDWKCINPTCEEGQAALDLIDAKGTVIRKGKLTAVGTTNNMCPCCNEAMFYEELEITYNGITGHVDGVIELEDGGYWVIDYKTSTKFKMDSGKLPERVHLKQLPAYSWILQNVNGLDIKGFSLLYLSRDNPFNFFDSAHPWTKKWQSKAKAMLKNEKKKFNSALRDFEKRRVKSILKTKPCPDFNHFTTQMSPYNSCPHAKNGNCFKPKRLEKILNKHLKAHPYKKKAAKKIIMKTLPSYYD